MMILYGGKTNDRDANLRYTSYCNASLCTRFQPEHLPPSESAAGMHAMCMHLQAVIWKTLLGTPIKPTEWGWKIKK